MNDTLNHLLPDDQPRLFCKLIGDYSACNPIASEPRQCQTKTCKKLFQPLCRSQFYCCISCMMLAEQWEQACERLQILLGQDEKQHRRQKTLKKAGQKYNQSEKGREKKRLQAQRRRDRDKAAKEADRAKEQQAKQGESDRLA